VKGVRNGQRPGRSPVQKGLVGDKGREKKRREGGTRIDGLPVPFKGAVTINGRWMSPFVRWKKDREATATT